MTLSKILSKKIVGIAYFMFELTQIEWDTSSKLGKLWLKSNYYCINSLKRFDWILSI